MFNIDVGDNYTVGKLSWLELWTILITNKTLCRERVKSQNLGNRTLNSESASKIMTACDIRALECMCKCLFFQKKNIFVRFDGKTSFDSEVRFPRH